MRNCVGSVGHHVWCLMAEEKLVGCERNSEKPPLMGMAPVEEGNGSEVEPGGGNEGWST